MIRVVVIATTAVVCARSESGGVIAVTLRPGEEYEATSSTDFHEVVKIPAGRWGFLRAEVARECIAAVREGVYLPEFEAAEAD